MRRVVLASLALASCISWFAIGGKGADVRPGTDRVRTEGSTSEATRLEGRTPVEGEGSVSNAAPSSGPATTEEAGGSTPTGGVPCRGVVVDAAGQPLAGATVFVVPKIGRARGAEPEDPPHQTTGADGTWDLGRRVLAGHWVGAVAKGHLPAYVDGDAPGASSLRLEMRDGPLLGVRVVNADGSAPEFGSRIEVVAAHGVAWPRPGEAWNVEQEFELAPGTSYVSVPSSSTSPVRIEVGYDHLWWNVDPENMVVDPPQDPVVFTLSRSGVIVFHVSDASTHDPLPRGFSYALLHPDGRLLWGGSTALAGGELRLNLGIRPGVYSARVWAMGYHVRETGPIFVPAPGDEARVEVSLEPDETLGTLRVRIPVLAELPRRKLAMEAGTYAAPASFLFRRPAALASEGERTFGTPSTWGDLAGKMERESDTEYVFRYVPPGEVTLFVCEVVSGRSAIVPSVQIPRGGSDSVNVSLEPGVFVDVDRALPAEGACRAFHVRHPAGGELGIWRLGTTTSWSEDPGTVPDRGERLGPYPGPWVEVEVERDDGSSRSVRFDAPSGG